MASQHFIKGKQIQTITVSTRKHRLWIGYFVPMITHNGRNMFSDGLM